MQTSTTQPQTLHECMLTGLPMHANEKHNTYVFNMAYVMPFCIWSAIKWEWGHHRNNTKGMCGWAFRPVTPSPKDKPQLPQQQCHHLTLFSNPSLSFKPYKIFISIGKRKTFSTHETRRCCLCCYSLSLAPSLLPLPPSLSPGPTSVVLMNNESL